MIGILLITHGEIGASMVAAAEYILGEQECLSVLRVDGDDLLNAPQRIDAEISTMVGCDGLVILTDMYGGTPSNISLTALDRDDVEIVTGVNLPMLLKCLTNREETASGELARQAQEAGQRGILVTRVVLESPPPA